MGLPEGNGESSLRRKHRVHVSARHARHCPAAAGRHADGHDRLADVEIACGRPVAPRDRRAGPLHAGRPRLGADDCDGPHRFRQFLLSAGGPGVGSNPGAGKRILRLCHATAKNCHSDGVRSGEAQDRASARRVAYRQDRCPRGDHGRQRLGEPADALHLGASRHAARRAPERCHSGAAARHRRTPRAGLRHRRRLAKPHRRQGERQGPDRRRARVRRERRRMVHRPRCCNRPQRAGQWGHRPRRGDHGACGGGRRQTGGRRRPGGRCDLAGSGQPWRAHLRYHGDRIHDRRTRRPATHVGVGPRRGREHPGRQSACRLAGQPGGVVLLRAGGLGCSWPFVESAQTGVSVAGHDGPRISHGTRRTQASDDPAKSA